MGNRSTGLRFPIPLLPLTPDPAAGKLCRPSWLGLWVFFIFLSFCLLNLTLFLKNYSENGKLQNCCCSVDSRIQLFAISWTAAHQASMSFTNSQSLPKLMSIDLMMPSNHFTFCRPLLFLPSIFPSIRVFSNELALLIRWPKYWSFSFSISPSNEYSGLISFRMDWLDLLAVQETLKSLLQHYSSKASILPHSDFFILQLSLTSIQYYWKKTWL